MSAGGWRGVNWRIRIRWSTSVLLLPILRTRSLLLGNTFSIMYGPIQRNSVNGIVLPWQSAFGCKTYSQLLLCVLNRWLFSRIKLCIRCRLAWHFCENLDGSFLFVENILGKLRSRNGLLLLANSQFQIQDIIGNTAVKNSARLAANFCVRRSIIIKDNNTAVFVPQWSSLACFNLQCLFDWRVRSLKQPNCLSVLCSVVL